MYMTFDFFYISVSLVVPPADRLNMNKTILYYKCILSAVSGLIIDAFGELRDQLDSVKENMESNCFICGIGKDYFDTVPHGFDTHVAKEHNLANYMWVLFTIPETGYYVCVYLWQ